MKWGIEERTQVLAEKKAKFEQWKKDLPLDQREKVAGVETAEAKADTAESEAVVAIGKEDALIREQEANTVTAEVEARNKQREKDQAARVKESEIEKNKAIAAKNLRVDDKKKGIDGLTDKERGLIRDTSERSFRKLGEESANAANLQTRIQTVRTLLNSPEEIRAQTGFFENVFTATSQIFHDLGMERIANGIVNLEANEANAAIVNGMVADLILSGGRAISNEDAERIAKSFPQIRNSVAGNNLILDILDAEAMHKREQKKFMAERMRRDKKGNPNFDYYSEAENGWTEKVG